MNKFKPVKMKRLLTLWGLLLMVAFLPACGDGENTVSVDEKQEFISFLSDIGLVSNDVDISIGSDMWSFSRDGTVVFGYVDSRVGNNWIVLFFAGDYTLSSKLNSEGEYTATCHFFLKESRWFPGNDVIIQVRHDETVTVRLKRNGRSLLINGVRFGKF